MIEREPLTTVASITALVAALIALAAAFGLPLTDTQVQAVLGFVAVVAPIAVGLLARSRVTPARKSEDRMGRIKHPFT